jgi:nucleoside-diphosphate-sugar epimerase
VENLVSTSRVMRILITGNLGYVVSALVRHLRRVRPAAELIGYHTDFFAHCLNCLIGAETLPDQLTRQHHWDVRDLSAELLVGVDAIVHLAAISKRPDGGAGSSRRPTRSLRRPVFGSPDLPSWPPGIT